MTRAEFIHGYIARSKLEVKAEALDDGFLIAGRKRLALPCACGEDICEGWAMVSDVPEDVKTHMELYAGE